MAPKRPAAQGWGSEVPSGHQKPNGQVWQSSVEVRFVDVENVPGGHRMDIGLPFGHCTTKERVRSYGWEMQTQLRAPARSTHATAGVNPNSCVRMLIERT
eukprot:1602686-Prymnesium_polylepis.2